MASMTLPRGQHHILPPGFGDDHLRAHLVEFHPQLPLMQVDLDAFHALQKKKIIKKKILKYETHLIHRNSLQAMSHYG